MALTNLDFLKSVLGVRTTRDDEQWAALLGVADALVKEYLGRDVESQSYTEYYSGNSTTVLVLRQYPVTQVVNVWEDPAGYFGLGESTPFDDTTLLLQGFDYVPYLTSDNNCQNGILYRLTTVWPQVSRVFVPGKLTQEVSPNFGNVKVNYTAGLTTIPADLQFATASLASYMKRTGPYGEHLEGERMGSVNYSVGITRIITDPHLGSVRQILNRYRDIPI